MRFGVIVLQLLCLSISLGPACWSQPAAGGQPQQEINRQTPSDPRETPRGAVLGFLEAAQQGDYKRAASFLNLRRQPAARRAAAGEELARQLKEILDWNLRTDPGLLSQAPDGALNDGLDPSLEEVGTILLDGRETSILLERVNREAGTPFWLFSSGTVAAIPALYKSAGGAAAQVWVPSWLREWVDFDSPLWRWTLLLLLLIFALLIAALITRIAMFLLKPVVIRTRTAIDDQLVSSVVQPLRFLLAMIIFRIGFVWLVPSVLVRSYIGRIVTALIVLGIAWLAMRLIDIVAVEINAAMVRRQRTSASSVIPLARRTAKVLAVMVAIVVILDSWGYDTTALIAGLGVGGLAVALAAQKTIENLFGGVAVTTDQPVRVGDFCRYGDSMGTVEDIGLRSTRVRTLDRTVVTIPNSIFSALEIENFAKRDKIWFHPIISLRADTTPDQVRYLLVEIRKLLYSHPKVDPNPARVRFVSFGSYSLDLEIFAYISTANMDEFLEVQEDLLLRMLDLIQSAGTSLAFPTQMNIVARDHGIDDEQRQAAVEKVRNWTEKEELLLPKFPPEKIAELAGTLEYPPRGSALKNGGTSA
ncbi:MAG: mechanosensitive ion channel family protein [Bryobacteraceae bacterium]